MGDIIDERGNTMPVPGNGRAKRARIDREGNMVVGGDVYYYLDDTSSALKASMRQLLTDNETLTAGAALDLEVPISIISGTSQAYTLAAGTYIGQRKIIVNSSGTGNTIAGAFMGATSPLTLSGAGESVSLVFVAPNWAIVGSSIREVTGTAIANAVGVVGEAP